MPVRESKEGSVTRTIEIHADIFTGSSNTLLVSNSTTTLSSPIGTLSQTSSSTMNRSHIAAAQNPATLSKPYSSIRAVPPESLQVHSSDADHENHTESDLPSLTQAGRAVSPLTTLSSSPTQNLPIANGMVRTISMEFDPSRVYNHSQSSDETIGGRSTSPGSSQWSSAVGHATLGTSSRMINKLMAEKDMLKRQLQIHQINTDDAREEKKLAEEKQRMLAEEVDKILHDAAITKTLLKKRDRQFLELQAQIDVERAKADAALVRELGWKEEMERVIKETDAKVQRAIAEADAKIERSLAESRIEITQAQEYTAMMEGRVKIMEDYWKENTEALSCTAKSLKEETERLILQRIQDSNKIKVLENLCQQRDATFDALMKDNESILAVHEAYKVEQEEALKDIKAKAVEQSLTNEQIMDESQKVLGHLRWALNVQQDAL